MSKSRRVFGLAISVAITVVTLGAAAAPAAASASRTLFVAPWGSNTNSCREEEEPCRTIGRAVFLASPGDTVSVEHGTYREQVKVHKRLKLVGEDNPTIDEAAIPFSIGILIEGSGAAGTVVRGFTVEHATFEGILARNTNHVTIQNNNVRLNDQGVSLPAAQQADTECAAHGQIPGDCGEGLHLWSVSDSKVLSNRVTNNAGGILLTDETGPTARNLVEGNQVLDNTLDCGITIAGHNPFAVSQRGTRQPAVAGIYDNTIEENTANRNGVAGAGAGILLAGAGPGTGVYDNDVIDNSASGNGLAGITLHRHVPNSDLNDNVFRGNHLGTNNLDGDYDFFPFFDAQTTGILIASFGALTGTVVKDNSIENDHFGIWTLNVPHIAKSANHFDDVTVKVHQQWFP